MISDGGGDDEGCPPEEQLLRLLQPEAAAEEREQILLHLDVCPGCRLAVAESTRGGGAAARPATLATLAPGEVLLGRYQIQRFIARGGMGEVYAAIDRQGAEIDRHGAEIVALKTLSATFLDDEAALFRFQGEARLARRVRHRNVCRLLDFGIHEQEGFAGERQAISFLTMELLEGVTLGRRIAARGPHPAAEIVDLLQQIAAGLGAIHQAGIVHRDLKTDNVFLVPDGDRERAVLMDFGLARALDGTVLTTLPHLLVGMVGTIDCMAPEQIEGGAVGPAADVYALGVLLFELLTGKRPFARLTPAARLLRPPPLPSTLVPGLARGWDQVVLRCLARRPEDRFPGLGDLLDALPRRREAAL
jgi:serine/threonine protein kinase